MDAIHTCERMTTFKLSLELETRQGVMRRRQSRPGPIGWGDATLDMISDKIAINK